MFYCFLYTQICFGSVDNGELSLLASNAQSRRDGKGENLDGDAQEKTTGCRQDTIKSEETEA